MSQSAEDGQGAGAAKRPRGVEASRRGTKPPGGASQQAAATQRVQLHLDAMVVRALGVHSAMAGRSSSRVASDVLAKWLARYGQGRELFDWRTLPDAVESSAEVIDEAGAT
jgi:hypothetical protein